MLKYSGVALLRDLLSALDHWSNPNGWRPSQDWCVLPEYLPDPSTSLPSRCHAIKESILKFPSISRSQLSFRWLAAARDQKQLTEGTGICEECSDQVVIVKKLELTYPDFFLIIFSFLLHFNSFGGKVAGATTPSSKAWCPDHFFQQSEGHRLQTQRGVDWRCKDATSKSYVSGFLNVKVPYLSKLCKPHFEWT